MTERKILLCTCEDSVEADLSALGRALADRGTVTVHSALCSTEQPAVERALAAGDTVVACGQMAALFEDIADALETEGRLATLDLRDRALWSDEAQRAGPKLAALMAVEDRPVRAAPLVEMESEGVCLVIGAEDVALPAARYLAEHLTVTCMMPEGAPLMAKPPFPVVTGRVRSASGHLGAFEIIADGLAELQHGGRGALAFGPARDGGRSACDVIVDLSGNTPLFSAHEKRDGYLRADPRDPAAVARVVGEAAHLVGTFEKPRYVDFHADLCAHSRSRKAGCTRCLGVCPTGAIASARDTVAIDPFICAGCGACTAVCPTGAAEFRLPSGDEARMRLDAMLSAYAKAGGGTPRILIHDETAGADLIAALARFGVGLPADMIPFSLQQVTQAGHDLLISALAMGAGAVMIHAPSRLRREGELAALEAQVALANALSPEARIALVETDDPDTLGEALRGARPGSLAAEPIAPLGDARGAVRLSVGALHPQGEVFALPEGAPYGAVEVAGDACTLCLACVSQCPVAALRDGIDEPALKFIEANCVQCGICEQTCPEQAITLVPRFDPSEAAKQPRKLHEDTPAECIECGKQFGTTGSVNRILDKLGGKHWMFQNPDRARIIQMCEDCRVGAVFKAGDAPFQMGERPKVRTTEDYLSDRAKRGEFDA